MLPAPPRTVASTGSAGSGASVLWRSAVLKEGVPHVCVDVRATEDTLRRVARALSVGSVEVCGDLLDFVEEACRMARATCGGETPLVVLRLREGRSMQRVHRDVAALAFDRRVCHVVVEVPTEASCSDLAVLAAVCCFAHSTLLPRAGIRVHGAHTGCA
nr:unnamed protein product [Leishmania braziliensis]